MAIYASFYFPLKSIKSISLFCTVLTFVDGQSEVFSATESRLCATSTATKPFLMLSKKKATRVELLTYDTRLTILPVQLKRSVVYYSITYLHH